MASNSQTRPTEVGDRIHHVEWGFGTVREVVALVVFVVDFDGDGEVTVTGDFHNCTATGVA